MHLLVMVIKPYNKVTGSLSVYVYRRIANCRTYYVLPLQCSCSSVLGSNNYFWEGSTNLLREIVRSEKGKQLIGPK